MTANIVKRLRKMSAENPSPRDCLDEAADALERLCIENGNLRREAWTWSKACEAATKQLEPERVDAKRYRWLRSWKRTADYKVSRWIAGEGRYDPLPQEGGLDAAIDADMAMTPNVLVTAEHHGAAIGSGNQHQSTAADKSCESRLLKRGE